MNGFLAAVKTEWENNRTPLDDTPAAVKQSAGTDDQFFVAGNDHPT